MLYASKQEEREVHAEMARRKAERDVRSRYWDEHGTGCSSLIYAPHRCGHHIVLVGEEDRKGMKVAL